MRIFYACFKFFTIIKSIFESFLTKVIQGHRGLCSPSFWKPKSFSKGQFDIQQIDSGWSLILGRQSKLWFQRSMKTCEKVRPDEPWRWWRSLLYFLRCSEDRTASIPAEVLLGWGSSAVMQQDVALTEAACPLSKSNYDNHASGKAAARRTAWQALIRQAAYLNHSSPPLQTPSSANVDGLLKAVWALCRLLGSKGACIRGEWRCFVSELLTDVSFKGHSAAYRLWMHTEAPPQLWGEQLARLTFNQNTIQKPLWALDPDCPLGNRQANKNHFNRKWLSNEGSHSVWPESLDTKVLHRERK